MSDAITAQQAAKLIEGQPHEIKGLIRFKFLVAEKWGVGYRINKDEFLKLCREQEVPVVNELSQTG